MREQNEIHEDLRGWAWDRPPVKPRAYLGLSISEVAYRYCDTYRSLWLRKKTRAQPRIGKDSPLSRGRDVHAIISLALTNAQEALRNSHSPTMAYEKLSLRARRTLREHGITDARLVEFYKALIHLTTASDLLRSMLGESHSSTLVVERLVDGSPLGLSSQLRVDALTPTNVVIEFKYGSNENPNHRVGLAGYALALESEMEAPVDFGLIFYIRNTGPQPRITYEAVYIGNHLRKTFLEYRDEAIDILLTPSPPPLATNCTPHCPYHHHCHPSAPGGGRR